MSTANEEMTPLEKLALKDQLLKDAKTKIAHLCSAIVESPETHLVKMRELRCVILDRHFSLLKKVRALVLVSICEVFKDILPDYKIRLMTDAEKKQQMKKDTLKLQKYEEALLVSYKKYLDILAIILKNQNYRNKDDIKKRDEGFLKIQWNNRDREIALKCACNLYENNPNFNYTDEIVTMIVPYLNSTDSNLYQIISNAVEQTFAEDKHGEISLKCIKEIHNFIKNQDYDVEAGMIRVFLTLNIKEISRDEKQKSLTHKEKLQQWSRSQRKNDKLMKKFRKNMDEMKSSFTRETRTKLNTLIVKEIFLIYFKILKTKESSQLLSAVLEGLSKYAHLIDLRFFGDIFQVLNEIVDRPGVQLIDSLHCVHTAVTILNHQGSTLDIDPGRFYTLLYRLLPRCYKCSDQEIDILVLCLDSLIVTRRRHVSTNRVLAFVKRLATASLMQSSSNSCVLLSGLLRYMKLFPKCEVLFETETEMGGPYLSELDEPELCNPSSAVLWEMELQQRSDCALIRKLANQIIRVYEANSARDDLSRLSTDQVRDLYTSQNEEPTHRQVETRQVLSKNMKSRKRIKLHALHDWCELEAKRRKLID